MLLGRMHQYGPKNIAEKAPNGIEYELKRLFYDIGTAYRPAIAALTSLVPTTQILFGSDNPFAPLAETAEGMMQPFNRKILQTGEEVYILWPGFSLT